MSDRGSATLLVALGCVLVVLVGTAGLLITSLLTMRVRAAAAADLAALAGATAVLDAPQEVCTRASRVARANGARLVDCGVSGADVRLEVAVPAPPALQQLLPGRSDTVRARAHAELTAGQVDP